MLTRKLTKNYRKITQKRKFNVLVIPVLVIFDNRYSDGLRVSLFTMFRKIVVKRLVSKWEFNDL